MKKLYCGGSFHFDYQQTNDREQAAVDYRAILLGTPERLLQPSDRIKLNDGAEYIGPFYFESEGMVDHDIVQKEIDMLRQCTDAVFLLDQAGCPGTICELTMASMLGKNVHLFYLRKSDEEETESSLHTPCWYPILHSGIINEQTRIYECRSREEAIDNICTLVHGWQRES